MASHRIVMIDDNQSDALVLEMCLDKIASDHELIVLNDGKAAFAFIEAERKGIVPKPCIFVLDIHLPEYDGLQILDVIKRAPALEHIAVLVISSGQSPDQIRRVNEAGAEYSPKPTSLDECHALAKRIWDLCQSRRGASA